MMFLRTESIDSCINTMVVLSHNVCLMRCLGLGSECQGPPWDFWLPYHRDVTTLIFTATTAPVIFVASHKPTVLLCLLGGRFLPLLFRHRRRHGKGELQVSVLPGCWLCGRGHHSLFPPGGGCIGCLGG